MIRRNTVSKTSKKKKKKNFKGVLSALFLGDEGIMFPRNFEVRIPTEATSYAIRREYSAIFFFRGATAPSGPNPHHYRGFTITLKTHNIRYDSSGRVISLTQIPLPDNTQHTHKRQTSVPPAEFEPAIPVSERPEKILCCTTAKCAKCVLNTSKPTWEDVLIEAGTLIYLVSYESQGDNLIITVSVTPKLCLANEFLLSEGCYPPCSMKVQSFVC